MSRSRFLKWQKQPLIRESPDPPPGFDVLGWMQELVDAVLNSDLIVCRYVKSTFASSRDSKPNSKEAELFPCPPPYPWISAK